MKDINFELYKVFYHVASLMSFSEASKQLFLSQSAVSQSIKLLEQKLKCKLFTRSTKKVTLTPEGEILLKHIEPAINLIWRGETQLLEVDSLNGGQLRIGANDTICRYYLIPYLNQFHQQYPNVHIRVVNQTSINCVALLESGQVDLVVVNFPIPSLMGGIHVRQLKIFQDVFLTSEKYKELRNRRVSLKELQRYPILMLEKGSTTSAFLHMIFQENQLDLVPEIEISSNDLLLDLCRIGLGITCVPDYCVKENGKGLFAIEIEEKIQMRSIAAAYNEKLPLSQAAVVFLEMVEHVFHSEKTQY